MDEKKQNKVWTTIKSGAKKIWPYMKVGGLCLLVGGVYGATQGYKSGRRDEAREIGENLYLSDLDKASAVEDRICSRLEERICETYDEHIDNIVKEYCDVHN